jgi:predicted membrane-bound spermidine synthase
MNRLTRTVSFLFFGSGLCALVYEVAWFREFRLVFGASTLANAAVLAVFIGGLGAGGLLLGKRVDESASPLRFYALLEAGAATLAALSPLLLYIARAAYIAAGGTSVLGTFLATCVRLVLTVLVLGGPTFLMGGTLPAAARAVESDDDSARRRVGLLYGANALGAVVGCLLANFVLLEQLGTRETLWSTAALNLVFAGIAWLVAPKKAATEALSTNAADPVENAIVPIQTAPIVGNAATDAPFTTSDAPASATAAMSAGNATSGTTSSDAKEPASDAPLPSDPATSDPATPVAPKETVAEHVAPAPRAAALRARDFAEIPPLPQGPEGMPDWYVPFAAAASGFVFFLMELVWYRMLGPLLGGTVFTFGIILAVALFGIGIGGTIYALFGSEKPATLNGFAVTCLLEAIFLAVPFALGDRIATLALLLRPLGSFEFFGMAAGWTIVTMVVVLPAAVVAGLQFPMLIALMGRGAKGVGVQTGWVYAANTAGSIAGALAGGFGLLSVVSVLGSWKLATGLLAVVGLSAGYRSLKKWADAPFRAMWTVLGAIAVFILLRTPGPTAVWRHSPIGVGRVPADSTASANAYRDWENSERRGMKWEEDGIESTVAIDGRHGFAFIVNGKSDGHTVVDAGTQVMAGIVGAILHPTRRAMVIGLGTGSSAGWLGALTGMERVDVAELEPAILHVAEIASGVNHHVLNNPLVHINIGDARELLLTTRSRYDLIFSEPSNPYRAGIANLFTREYYEAAESRLTEDGLFLQWVQAYDIDKRTLRAVYATLGSVFPEIETWELAINDLLLVASKKPIKYDIAAIRDKIAREPIRSALLGPWRAVDAEGFFGHYVGNAAFGRTIAEAHQEPLATDDRNLIEFGFARNANASRGSIADELRLLARIQNNHRPAGIERGIDWERVDDGWLTFQASSGAQVTPNSQMNEGQRRRAAALGNFLQGSPQGTVAQWAAQKRDPIDPTEIAMLAQSVAEAGDEAALPLIDRLRPLKGAEAAAILARLRLRQNRLPEATAALETAFTAYRSEPWSWPFVMSLAIESVKELTARDQSVIPRVREMLGRPFVVNMFDDSRRSVLLALDMVPKVEPTCTDVLKEYEPHVPWRQEFLGWRTRCYSLAKGPHQERATRELEEFNRNTPVPFGKGLDFVRVSQ